MTYDYQELVTDLYRVFGTPVTLLDSGDRVLAFSDQPPGLSDEFRRENLLVNAAQTPAGEAVLAHVNRAAHSAKGLIRTPPMPEWGLLARTVIPLFLDGSAVAFAYLIDPDEKVTDARLKPFEAQFASVARQVEMQRMAKAKVHAALMGTFSKDPQERRLGVSMLEELGAWHVAPPFRVAVLGSSRNLSRVPDSSWRRLFGRDSLWTGAGSGAVALLHHANDATVDVMQRAVQSDDSAALSFPTALGLGAQVEELGRVHESYRQAMRAQRLAQSTGIDERSAVWDELGAWRWLLALDVDGAIEALDERVASLATAEPAETVRLVRAYLERDADADQIAADHHLHRTTLYSKMRRLQERYGLSWEASEDRMATILGVRLAQLNHPKDPGGAGVLHG